MQGIASSFQSSPNFSPYPILQAFPQPSQPKDLKHYISSLLSITQSKLSSPANPDIIFDSYFECGNLEAVHEKSSNEFDLILKNDSNTSRHTHWFMFKVLKRTRGLVKFNILNYMKRKSLISKGLNPVVSHKNGAGSVRGLRYCRTFDDNKKYFTVSFEFEFDEDDEAVFSLNEPYSYSRLLGLFRDIERIEDFNAPKKIVQGKIVYKRETLCYSDGGVPIYLVTITGSEGANVELGEKGSKKRKKGAIITARVHPSETVASFVVEGFIRFLLGSSSEADSLRKHFIFKIIPMLNPDGVILGNSRTSILGFDLNRVWIDPDPLAHPSIFNTKNFIKKFNQKHEILVYLDLHGHSKKIGTFIYGCNKVVNGSFASWTKVRLYPRIIAKNTIMFAYNNCIFNIFPSKEGTGRVVVWREIGISNSFTIETSIFGYHNGFELAPYSLSDLGQIGEEICKSLLEYTILLKSLEKELQMTNGWLKPSKFKEVSGTPAVQLVTRRPEAERKDLRTSESKDRAKARPVSRALRLKVRDSAQYSDWKAYFTPEEVQQAQDKIRLGLESPRLSSSSESSDSEKEAVQIIEAKREASPVVEDLQFWVNHPRPMKPVKKELEPVKCRFVKQHTSDFSGCYLDNFISKNISSDTFKDHQRNMFFSRAERSRIHKEKIAKTRSMSNKREPKNLAEIGEFRAINEKIFKIRPKVQKNYFFTKEKQMYLPPSLCVNSLRVNPAKRDSLGKL